MTRGLDRLRQLIYRGPRRRLAFERYVRTLERAPWSNPAEMDRQRSALLRGLLTATTAKVPSLAARFRESGVDPASVRTIDGLAALPPVTKADLMAVPRDELVNRDARDRLMWLGTSGSSGQPFSFAVDPFFHSRSDAVRGYVYRTGGFRRGVAVEMYAAPGSTSRNDPGVGFDRHIIDYGRPVGERARTIMSIDPDLLYGNRSHLLELADELERTGATLGKVRHVISSSEPLGIDDRRRIGDVFGVKPRDLYGLAELSTLCFERRPECGYTVIEPRAIVEVLVDGRPAETGELGEIVVTSLDNHVMPFIRYATGDLARLSAEGAASGRSGMLIERIEGRLVDTLRRLDGMPVAYWALGTSAIWSHRDVVGRVRQWQVVQDGERSILVQVSPGERMLDDAARSHITTSISSAVGPGFDVRVVEVEQIPLESNGKYKAVKVAFD